MPVELLVRPVYRTGGAIVGVVHCFYDELRAGRQWQADTDQSFLEQQSKGLLLRGISRNIVAWASRAIDQSEDRIAAIACGETCLNALGADAPSRLRFATRQACPLVRPKHLEKRIIRCVGRAARLVPRNEARRIEIRNEFRNF
jgi:hypothetical protein